MDEFIKREDALDALLFGLVGTGYQSRAISAIKYVPAVKVVEHRRGKWTLRNDGSGICSECHTRQLAVWDMDRWQNFCGNCGADMREVYGDE